MVAGVSLAVVLLWKYSDNVVQENHIVEWAQALLLVAAAGVHGRRSTVPNWRGENILRLGLAVLCISFAVREVDIDRFGPVTPTVETVVRLGVAVAWLAVAWRAMWLVRTWWFRKWQIVWSGAAVVTFAGCVLYLASWPFDKHPDQLGGASLALLFEETIQLNATILLLLASSLPTLRQRGREYPTPESTRTA